MARYSEDRSAPRASTTRRVASTLSEESLSQLATRALTRLHAERHASVLSDEAQACIRVPLATALATALCDDATDIADLMVGDLVEAGLSVEEICLDYLAPAARCLGEWWEGDRLPFTEVTMATARIQAMLRRLPAGRRGTPSAGAKGAVFCAVPGEEHTLGVVMAADLFRRIGWDMGLLIGLEHDEILSRLKRDDRAVIGLSCSGDHSLPALGRLMTSLRRARPDARLIVSGRIAGDARAVASLPEPDAVVTCMADAEIQMRRLDAELRAEPAPRETSYA
ncbi:cobalamin-dependent protein [Roseibacterium sp. SDUM158017]|uniref:cobalamin B12-binding domain-containing protein n=1 Tax=Roseicyclus salinarum TaxID=3036773 RepID=UPI002414D2CF|nr:cobalamin-dependent protein [Roseibacterium sp. SDUM158017]MDG4650626.1 cobalamin-dependent protein [Roseibacterium sp. SDUM158017]